jgi:hypothetical protein
MMLRDRMVSGVKERNPLKTRRYSESHLLSPDFHMSIFEYRCDSVSRSLSGCLCLAADGVAA